MTETDMAGWVIKIKPKQSTYHLIKIFPPKCPPHQKNNNNHASVNRNYKLKSHNYDIKSNIYETKGQL